VPQLRGRRPVSGSSRPGDLPSARSPACYPAAADAVGWCQQGSRPPYAESVGSGTALVLGDGQAWTAHWPRLNANGGTTFTTASGQPMTFAPGQVFVVLTYW
jgi:Protein of unknown function (DUF3048) C-terminal domain